MREDPLKGSAVCLCSANLSTATASPRRRRARLGKVAHGGKPRRVLSGKLPAGSTPWSLKSRRPKTALFRKGMLTGAAL